MLPFKKCVQQKTVKIDKGEGNYDRGYSYEEGFLAAHALSGNEE